jgi:hypothetical protein
MKSQKFRKNRKTIKRATLIGQHTIKGGRKKKYLKNNNRQNQIRRNTRKMRGGTRALLMDNIRSGNIEEVTRILRTGGVELNNIDRTETPLILAVQLKKYDIVRLLLEHGADPNSMAPMRLPGMQGEGTALGNAIAIAHVPTARLLLNNRASIEGVCFNNGTRDFTPLDHAVNLSNIQMVRLLLEHGANPNTTVGYSGQMNRAQANVMAILNAYRDALRDNTILPHLMEPRLSDIEIQREMRQVERERDIQMRQVERERVTPLVRERVTPLERERDWIIREMLILPPDTPQPINLEEILTEDKLSTLRNLSMNDRSYFLKKQIETQPTGQTILLEINRDNAFNDSIAVLNKALSGNDKYSSMNIKFNGEEGIDSGGLTKEYFSIVSKELIDPNKNLFYSYDNNNTFQPNFFSKKNVNYIEQFKFIGRLVGKAICLGVTLDSLVFTIPFRKHIIGKEIVLEDLQSKICDLPESNSYYNYLKFIKDKDMSFIGEQEYKMPVPGRDNKNPETIYYQSLKENNENETVFNLSALGREPSEGNGENGEYHAITASNKAQFIQDSIKYITTESIKPQIDAFLDGLYSMVPKKFLELFTVEELDLLINGSPTVDIKELKTKTKYDNFEENDKEIAWLWEILETETQEFRKKFLKFVTGSSRIGVDFKLTIKKINDDNKVDHYPRSHTCFNKLDLPLYSSKEQLTEKLSEAINIEGFGIA